MRKGFTLVEVLVVISIIGVMLGVSLIGLQGSRESSRDVRRKSDIELVRAGLELYKADCKAYPTNNIFASGAAGTPAPLVGDGTPTSCSPTNTYIAQVPQDPFNPNRVYLYSVNASGTTYEICTALEQLCTSNCPSGQTAVPVQTCGGSSNCGEAPCNYKQTNP